MDIQPIQVIQPGNAQVGSSNAVDKGESQESIFPSDSNKVPTTQDNILPEEKEDKEDKSFLEKFTEGAKKTIDDILTALGLKKKGGWADLADRKNKLNKELNEIQQQQLDASRQLHDLMKEADKKAQDLDKETNALDQQIKDVQQGFNDCEKAVQADIEAKSVTFN